ncbi:vitamin B6 photo-protection and homoeostasis-domain-containing protein [Scenedesmus sp. NREL 46B-D3]|nr:vitamin B6 photo-protection and homoeostasis-domain-containing protein [Scenedesmus sp. NREL 46B-D3]
MAGGIIFAYAAGGNFDSNAKQWRLFADVMNDLAMALDLASPLIPGGFMLMASLGSVARAMVGMASGATHAALTQHFATAGSNAADISAKADSRERATVIIGSLLGMAVTQRMADNAAAAWLFFAVLTWLHVWANIRALRCLVLSSVNEPRLRLLLQHYQDKEKLLTPQQVSGLESLLVPPLAAAWLRATGSQQHAPLVFGAQLSAALRRAAAAAAAAAAGGGASCSWPAGQQGQLLQHALHQQRAAADKQYLLLVTGRKHKAVEVVLHTAAGQQVQLRAYLHALQLAAALQEVGSDADVQQLLQRSQHWAERSLPSFLAALQQHGWELDKLFLPRSDWTAEW